VFHDILEIFDLAGGDGGAVFRIVASMAASLATPVDGDFLCYAMAADRLRGQWLGHILASLSCQQKIDGLARLIHGTREIAPLALHFDARLVHAPADPHRTFAPMERLL
jgi:hypothetical protein